MRNNIYCESVIHSFISTITYISDGNLYKELLVRARDQGLFAKINEGIQRLSDAIWHHSSHLANILILYGNGLTCRPKQAAPTRLASPFDFIALASGSSRHFNRLPIN